MTIVIIALLIVVWALAGITIAYAAFKIRNQKANMEAYGAILSRRDEIVDALAVHGFHFYELGYFKEFSTINKAQRGLDPRVFLDHINKKEFELLDLRCQERRIKACMEEVAF